MVHHFLLHVKRAAPTAGRPPFILPQPICSAPPTLEEETHVFAPHSGQNLGLPSIFVPHSVQNFSRLMGWPHSAQNFAPGTTLAPQFGQPPTTVFSNFSLVT